jgi:hypothetical protein
MPNGTTRGHCLYSNTSPIVPPGSVRFYGGCAGAHHGRERCLWIGPRSVVVRLLCILQQYQTTAHKRSERNKCSSPAMERQSSGTQALSDAPACPPDITCLTDSRELISWRGTYHVALDHGGAAMMDGAIAMGRPYLACGWSQLPPRRCGIVSGGAFAHSW